MEPGARSGATPWEKLGVSESKRGCPEGGICGRQTEKGNVFGRRVLVVGPSGRQAAVALTG